MSLCFTIANFKNQCGFVGSQAIADIYINRCRIQLENVLALTNCQICGITAYEVVKIPTLKNTKKNNYISKLGAET